MNENIIVRLILSLAGGVGIAGLLYIHNTTGGSIWHAEALSVAKPLSFLAVLAFLLFTFTLYRTLRIVLFFLCLFAYFVVPIPAHLDCTLGSLSGGYDRLTNCGIDIQANVAVLTGIGFLTLQGRNGVVFAVFTACATFMVTEAADARFRNALMRELAGVDLGQICVVRDANRNIYSQSLAHAYRITRLDDLDLGRLIGERAPRIYIQDGKGMLIWSYAKRTFISTRVNHLLVVCDAT